jgi:hypothetical protein
MQTLANRIGPPTAPISAALWQWACMMRSSIPGIVRAFDPVKQTCTVEIAIQEYAMQPPQGDNLLGSTQNVPTPTAIDLLYNVKIVMTRVPGWSITMPITPGTECLLVFSDMCIDGWWQTGQVSVQMDRRRHDLSDAIALFGPWSQPNNLENYSTTSMQLRSDDQTVVIDLSPGRIAIKAPEVAVYNTGGLAIPLVNANFYEWFTTVFMPAVSYVTAEPALPVNPETSVFTAE